MSDTCTMTARNAELTAELSRSKRDVAVYKDLLRVAETRLNELTAALAVQTARAERAEAALAEAAGEFSELAADWHRYGGSPRRNHRAPWEACTDDTCVEHRRFVGKLIAVNLGAILAAGQPAPMEGQ